MSYLDNSQRAAAWGGMMEEIRGGTWRQGAENFRQMEPARHFRDPWWARGILAGFPPPSRGTVH